MLPEWPGNEEAKTHDFKAGFQQDDDGNWSKFTEPEPENGVGAYHLPPSFNYFTKEDTQWVRPEEYIREILYENEVQRRRAEKKREFKLRKDARKTMLMALSTPTSAEEQEKLDAQETELEMLNQAKHTINKDEIVVEPRVIDAEERMETEAEI